MLYNVNCKSARKRGAEGIFYFCEDQIDATTPEAAEDAFREKFETCGPPVEVSPVHCKLQNQLQAALGLPDSDFGYHASDLYVIDSPGVREWLKANYQFYGNVRSFVGSGPWDGKPCLDIPFALLDK